MRKLVSPNLHLEVDVEEKNIAVALSAIANLAWSWQKGGGNDYEDYLARAAQLLHGEVGANMMKLRAMTVLPQPQTGVNISIRDDAVMMVAKPLIKGGVSTATPVCIIKLI